MTNCISGYKGGDGFQVCVCFLYKSLWNGLNADEKQLEVHWKSVLVHISCKGTAANLAYSSESEFCSHLDSAWIRWEHVPDSYGWQRHYCFPLIDKSQITGDSINEEVSTEWAPLEDQELRFLVEKMKSGRLFQVRHSPPHFCDHM